MHKNEGLIVEVPGLADIHVSAGPDEPSDSVVVVVRPEALHVLRPEGASSTDNAVAAHITETVYLGSSRKLRARLANGAEAIVREPAGEIGSARVGDDILLGWNKDDCSVVPVAEMGSAPSTATRPFLWSRAADATRTACSLQRARPALKKRALRSKRP